MALPGGRGGGRSVRALGKPFAGRPVNPLASDEFFHYRARNIEKSMNIWHAASLDATGVGTKIRKEYGPSTQTHDDFVDQ
ncbi:MAG: hypothetical protein HZB24_04550 [Desulfobacterales bacterium]|nr:hypothetical protein [Desulfobacterales bacterium]